MGDYFLTVCNKPWKGPEEKEPDEIVMHSFPRNIMDERYGVDHFEVMWRKGLRYLSTILATAYDRENINREGMKGVFEELRRKVRVWIRDGCAWYRGNYVATRVLWPCDILDLKEVQDEVKMLNGFLLSKDNPDDVEMMRRIAGRPFDESTIRWLNICVGDLRAMLTRATEFHHKHPDVKFWFYTVYI